MKIITNSNYVEEAEKVIQSLKNKKNPKTGRDIPMVTTSKIRNLLAMTADIYNETLNIPGNQLPERLNDRIEYLRIRFIYEVGKDSDGRVKNFVTEAGILDILREIKGIKSNFILFNRYMEALVAFHRFYDGKDN
mgnify:FL=1